MKQIFFIVTLYIFCINCLFALDKNLIVNGDFSKPLDNGWSIQTSLGSSANYQIKDNIFQIQSTKIAVQEEYALQLYQEGIKLENGGVYKLSFEAESDAPEAISVKMAGNASNNYKKYTYKRINITPKFQRYQYIFSMDAPDKNARLEFWFTKVRTHARIRNITLTLIDSTNVQHEILPTANLTKENFGELIWSEEFDVDGKLNKKNWVHELGGGGWGNEEEQFYTDSEKNAFVEHGALHIVAIKENYKGNKYTSARIATKGKQTFKYGKFEVRAKLPSSVGTWPAIWLFGRGSQYSEIDIMEHVGAEQGSIHFSVHASDSFQNAEDHKTSTIKINNVDTKFHNYTLEWTPDFIRGFVDGIEYFQMFKKDFYESAWKFDEKMFLILNLAIGGTWGGVNGVDKNFSSDTFEVEYVRVYEYKKN